MSYLPLLLSAFFGMAALNATLGNDLAASNHFLVHVALVVRRGMQVDNRRAAGPAGSTLDDLRGLVGRKDVLRVRGGIVDDDHYTAVPVLRAEAAQGDFAAGTARAVTRHEGRGFVHDAIAVAQDLRRLGDSGCGVRGCRHYLSHGRHFRREES